MSRNRCRTGVRTFIAALAAAGVQQVWAADGASAAVGAPKAGTVDAALQASAQAAMDKGLAWLKSHQKESGAWSDENYPALTALGLWAASRSGRPEMADACAKAAAFVAGFARDDGSIFEPPTGGRGSGGLSTYNTAICMAVLHEYNRTRYAPLILKARAYMVGSQFAGDSRGAGGFGYDRPGHSPRDRADLSNTGWALMAMHVTRDVEDARPGSAKVDVDWGAALRFVEGLRSRDEGDTDNYGSFGYEGGGERGGTTVGRQGAVALRGFGSMTYAGLESLIYAQIGRTDPRIRSALVWAARHWSVDENPGMGSKGLFYYYTVMAKALRLAGGETLQEAKGQPIPWRRDLATKLVSLQHADGSWANADNTFWENDPALVTAYAVLTLQYAIGK